MSDKTNNNESTMGTKQASEHWGVASATVSRWCRERRIVGAYQDAPGSPWHIPIDAKRPRK